MLQEEVYSVSGHENFFSCLIHNKHIVQIYSYPNIYPPQNRQWYFQQFCENSGSWSQAET